MNLQVQENKRQAANVPLSWDAAEFGPYLVMQKESAGSCAGVHFAKDDS